MRRFLAPLLVLTFAALSGCTFFGGLQSSEPPTAVLNADPTSGRAPLRVRFDAGASYDDGAIVRYAWSFGEGDTADSVDAERTFETCGAHTVRLQVVDDDGLVGTAEILITVENTPPLASCRFSSDSPAVGEWILFDASASYDPDGRLVDFTWDFGDGTSTRGTRVGHAYEEIGGYTVRLTIVDDAGATASITHTFTVHSGGGGGGCGGGSVCLGLV